PYSPQENSASLFSPRLHGRENRSQSLFLNSLADAQPTTVLEHQLQSGRHVHTVVTDKGETGCSVLNTRLVPLLTAGFQFALPPIELAFLHAALPAKFPNRHPAPRCIPNRPLPIPLLLDIAIFPVHPTPPPFRDTLSRAGHYCCLRFKGGRWVGRTGTIVLLLFCHRRPQSRNSASQLARCEL